MDNNMLLNGKVAIVVGSSRNIGLEIAKMLAENGCGLALTDIKERFDILKETAEKLQRDFQVKINTYILDTKKIDDIKKVYADIYKEFGKIDILINNAGINILSPALDIDEGIWDSVVDVNLKGTFFSMQQAAKYMILDNGGAIVSIASQHGVVGNLNRAPYCASKAGIINLSKALSYEWAKYNIRVNVVSPTFTINETNREFLSQPKQKKNYMKKIPLQRYCTPHDIANAVLYLVSDNSKIVTGHNLLLDGGWTAI